MSGKRNKRFSNFTSVFYLIPNITSTKSTSVTKIEIPNKMYVTRNTVSSPATSHTAPAVLEAVSAAVVDAEVESLGEVVVVVDDVDVDEVKPWVVE